MPACQKRTYTLRPESYTKGSRRHRRQGRSMVRANIIEEQADG
jgi:hypothetical protein